MTFTVTTRIEEAWVDYFNGAPTSRIVSNFRNTIANYYPTLIGTLSNDQLQHFMNVRHRSADGVISLARLHDFLASHYALPSPNGADLRLSAKRPVHRATIIPANLPA